MKRHALHKLQEWKDDSHRKPMLIQGARQVGKTWLMKEFGKQFYSKVAYIHFDNNSRMQEIFNSDYDIKRLITAFQIEAGCTITANDTLLIFDEIQEAPRALNSLKYFCEEAPQYPIIAAGSLLGVAMHNGEGFPVGKVDFLDLYPLSFSEFLDATGNTNLNELLNSHDWELINTFKSKFIDLLRLYYYIGGMPEAVYSFLEYNDLEKVRHIQKKLLRSYENDFSKHAPKETVPRIKLIWNSIPTQLAKENKKFIFGAIRDGARARDFELAMQWLVDAGMIYHVFRASKPAIPLNGYQGDGFKAFMLDIGLLGAKANLNAKTLLNGYSVFQEFKGALTEQYVQQQLRDDCGIKPFYWSRENGGAEVEFIYQSDSTIIPVEVKAEENLQAKSLKVYCEKFAPPCAIRTSMSNYRSHAMTVGNVSYKMINLPLYAINQIQYECEESAQ